MEDYQIRGQVHRPTVGVEQGAGHRVLRQMLGQVPERVPHGLGCGRVGARRLVDEFQHRFAVAAGRGPTELGSYRRAGVEVSDVGEQTHGGVRRYPSVTDSAERVEGHAAGHVDYFHCQVGCYLRYRPGERDVFGHVGA